MNALFAVSLTFFSVFGVGLLAMRLRRLLPENHRNSDTKDTVKLAMGLIATISALVLGLMVASAKGSYDVQKGDVITAAAKIVMLDRMLAHYGPDAAPARALLLKSSEVMQARLWPEDGAQTPQFDPSKSPGDALFDLIEALPAPDARTARFKDEAMSLAIDLGEIRWQLFEQASRSISPTLLVVLVCWLAILFLSFGLFAPGNATAILALMVSALSASGAIFLILELDEPFTGLIRISRASMEIAVSHLGR